MAEVVTTATFLRGTAVARQLQEGGGASNATTPAVFWGVNAFILFLVLTACLWCCCIAASMKSSGRDEEENEGNNLDDQQQTRRCSLARRLVDRFIDFSRTIMTIEGRDQSSDEAYRQMVLRRRRREVEARRDSPEKRQKKLIASFKRCGNYMVVEASDIINPEQEEKEKSKTDSDASSQTPVILEAECGLPLGDAVNDKEGDKCKGEAGVNDERTPNSTTDAEAPAIKDEAQAEAPAALTEAQAPSLIASLAAIFGGSQRQVVVDDEPQNENSREDTTGETTETAANGEAATDANNDNQEENENASTGSASSDMTNTDGYIVLRCKKENPKIPYRPRRVPNCCAICLCPYEVGDTVCWAYNPGACPHAYHEDCILDWLVKLHQVQQHNLEQNGGSNNENRRRRSRFSLRRNRNDSGNNDNRGGSNNSNGNAATATERIDPDDPYGSSRSTIGSSLNSTPCPCCRADFTDLEKYRKQSRIKWGAGNAFNPSTIAWR